MLVQKIAMVRPNGAGIYAPSRIAPVPVEKNLTGYSRVPMLISFEPDGLSNPQPVTAYGRGWDCWWIEAPKMLPAGE